MQKNMRGYHSSDSEEDSRFSRRLLFCHALRRVNAFEHGFSFRVASIEFGASACFLSFFFFLFFPLLMMTIIDSLYSVLLLLQFSYSVSVQISDHIAAN